MGEATLFLLTSFWLGAVHAATPGHGKTIAASYIVGVRGRPVDALVLGIFVTLSHTSGIILVAVLAVAGSTWLIPQRIEAYLAIGTGVLVIAIGCWMLKAQMRVLATARLHRSESSVGDYAPDHRHEHGGAHAHAHSHSHDHSHPHAHEHSSAHTHEHDNGPHYHSHGWGMVHTHDLEALTSVRPTLPMLLALGIAGGLLPDPGALAILLAAIAKGQLLLGVFTVVVFSLGFASVLVVVGVVAARVGQLILAWLSSRWISWVQIGAALLIIAVGLVLTANALRNMSSLG
jgi:nickel/cobalt transporter (NicO) family protein